MKSDQSLIKTPQISDQKIPQSKKYNNEKLDKEYQISINLIAQTSLDEKLKHSLSQQEKIQMVLELRSIHLEWLNIKKIENLEVFQKLTVLYLQHNQIKKIENLECLKNLEYLALNDNQITQVQNLKHLTKLQGLNLNNNFIEDLNPKELPQNLQLLSFKNNPIALDTNYKKDIIKHLKVLEVLDDVVISSEEKFKAIGIFPSQLMEYASQINQFRRKKEIQKSLKQQNKPILLGGESINQKQAQFQVRQKTKQYLQKNKETFKTQIKDQVQNFEQKIIVSKNIRQIKQQEQKSRKNRLQQIRQKKIQEIDREISQIKRAVKSNVATENKSLSFLQNKKSQEIQQIE